MLNRPVLVALVGSELSEKALPYAVSNARATDRPLVLSTVGERVDREFISTPPAAGRIIARPVLGSLHDEYEWIAA